MSGLREKRAPAMVTTKTEPEGLAIVLWGDSILSTKCEPVDKNEFGEELGKLGKRMLLAMGSGGIGLAAPQVGLAKRLFVMKRSVGEHRGNEIIAVNPHVVPSKDQRMVRAAHEECLSLPNIKVLVSRPEQCLLTYQHPITSEQTTIELLGLDARCAQHEDDHLSGKLIIDSDRTTKRDRRRALKQLEAQRAHRPSGKA